MTVSKFFIGLTNAIRAYSSRSIVHISKIFKLYRDIDTCVLHCNPNTPISALKETKKRT